MSAPLIIDEPVLINEELSGKKCSYERKEKVRACLASCEYYGSA